MATLRLLSAAVSVGLLAAASAVAQDTDRQFEAGRAADFQDWQWRARLGAVPTEADKAVTAVADAVGRRDCSAAVSALNAGLAKGYPDVLVLAGAMYEDGVCLKPNWDRAAGFYEKAVAAGHPSAAPRLAAGFAAPEGGKDRAAALWWAMRANTPMPAPCRSAAMVKDDPDKFVAALGAWPAGQLDACVYSAAVMASLQAEIESPRLASAYGLQGRVRLAFVPGQPQVDVTEDLRPAGGGGTGVVADAATLERDTKAAREALTGRVRQVAERALKRYAKPAGVPTAWRVESEHVLASAR